MIQMNCSQYLSYVANAAGVIAQNGDYITGLDAVIGDGDHWLNINIGFQKLLEQSDEFRKSADFQELFKKLAMTTMSAMGGTSGALYGSAYLSASKILKNVTSLDDALLAQVLTSWGEAFMKRGNAQPGDKTMIDAIYPASKAYSEALGEGVSSAEALSIMKKAAQEGAESTKDMDAAKGRASNQPDKGRGHLDPGAVTFSMQLTCLADYITENCIA
ncbi:MAG: dihydroxyacetone kinase subunit DhaL [Acetanaerobacterium sp.]